MMTLLKLLCWAPVRLVTGLMKLALCMFVSLVLWDLLPAMPRGLIHRSAVRPVAEWLRDLPAFFEVERARTEPPSERPVAAPRERGQAPGRVLDEVRGTAADLRRLHLRLQAMATEEGGD